MADVTIVHPSAGRALPTPADFARVRQLPIAQLFVVGRSGSSVIHAFLDGHPEVLHVPHTFKFYDFVAANPDVVSRPPAEIASRFIESPLVPYLMDSRKSVIIGGRLGPEMSTYIRIDVDRFRDAFVSATCGVQLTERSLFVALVMTYGWCVGQELSRVKVVLQHLHHGDWLFPERLIERYNYQVPLSGTRVEPLRGDKFIVPLRAPYDGFLAYVKYTASPQHGLGPTAQIDLQEQFLRMLMQDWDRVAAVRTSGKPHVNPRLEDIRSDAGKVVEDVARFLEIDSTEACLQQLTYYGFAWHGDIYTEPTTTVLKIRPSRSIEWQERWICDAVIGPEATRYGYEMGLTGQLKRALLPLTVAFPATNLLDPSIESQAERQAAARSRAQARIDFGRRLAMQSLS